MLDSLATDEAKSRKTLFLLHYIQEQLSNFVITLLAMHGSFGGLSCSLEAKKSPGFLSQVQGKVDDGH